MISFSTGNSKDNCDTISLQKKGVQTMQDAILTMNHINKSYGNTQVLNNIDMEIPRGAIYGLVGSNGGQIHSDAHYIRSDTMQQRNFFPFRRNSRQ